MVMEQESKNNTEGIMRGQKTNTEKSNPVKTILLLFLIAIIFFSTSVALTSYPQHIFINNATKIDVVKFLDGNKLILKGNMVQYGAGDVIPIEGRSYLKLTGKQAQIGGSTYKEGIRSITADISQNVLFSQEVGVFSADSMAQVVVEGTVINLIPISNDTFNVNVQDLSTSKTINNYNLQFTQSTTYTNDNGIMLKLTKKQGRIYVSLIGIKPYRSILFRTG